ncbi:MAG: hypothetical protein ACR2LN_05850 [Candidatus Levyibacteriota bacterium]
MAGKESKHGHGVESRGEMVAKILRNGSFVAAIIGTIGWFAALAIPAGAIMAGGVGGTVLFDLTKHSIHAKNNPSVH